MDHYLWGLEIKSKEKRYKGKESSALWPWHFTSLLAEMYLQKFYLHPGLYSFKSFTIKFDHVMKSFYRDTCCLPCFSIFYHKFNSVPLFNCPLVFSLFEQSALSLFGCILNRLACASDTSSSWILYARRQQIKAAYYSKFIKITVTTCHKAWMWGCIAHL